LSPFYISNLPLSKASPQTPFSIVIGRTTKGFYFSLADQFKILGSSAEISVGKKRTQHNRKSQISLPK